MIEMTWKLLICISILTFIVIGALILKISSKKNKKNINYYDINHIRPDSQTNTNLYNQKQFSVAAEPVLSTHASERMSQRLGVSYSKQSELMNTAYMYGKTASRTNGDLKLKLEDIESKYNEETTAKYYNGVIYIFSQEDNVLKTVYPYNVNNYMN